MSILIRYMNEQNKRIFIHCSWHIIMHWHWKFIFIYITVPLLPRYYESDKKKNENRNVTLVVHLQFNILYLKQKKCTLLLHKIDIFLHQCNTRTSTLQKKAFDAVSYTILKYIADICIQIIFFLFYHSQAHHLIHKRESN